MNYLNLDTVCNRILLEKGLPVHYYFETLAHCASAIRELSKDTLQVVNTVPLVVNDYFACDLPDDFVDDVAVSVPVGNLLQRVGKRTNITPLLNHDQSSGQFIPYSSGNSNGLTLSGLNMNWTWMWNVNDLGESTGRYFGANGQGVNGYQIFKERRQIQLTESFSSPSIVLMYIGNGQSVDNATQIDWGAHAAIQSYCAWKMSRSADMVHGPEAATYYNEKRLLRSFLNPITAGDIKDIVRRNAIGQTIKG